MIRSKIPYPSINSYGIVLYMFRTFIATLKPNTCTT